MCFLGCKTYFFYCTLNTHSYRIYRMIVSAKTSKFGPKLDLFFFNRKHLTMGRSRLQAQSSLQPHKSSIVNREIKVCHSKYGKYVPISSKIPKFCITNIFFCFCLKHTIPVITDANVLQTFTPLGYGELLAKNNFQDKLAGGGGLGQENIQKFTTYFCNLEARNFKFGTQHEFGFTLPNTTFRTNIDGSELGPRAVYPRQKN